MPSSSSSSSSSPRSPSVQVPLLFHSPSSSFSSTASYNPRPVTLSEKMDELLKRAKYSASRQFLGFGSKRTMAVVLSCSVAAILTLSSFWLPVPSFGSFSLQEAQREPPPRIPPDHLNPLPMNASLSERLAAWRSAPGRNWEQADFIQWNLETCSNWHHNQNKDLLMKANLVWAQMNSSQIGAIRERMAMYLEEHEANGSFDEVPVRKGGKGLVGEGRGIVFTAGNADTLSRVVLTLKYMRKYLNSTLPAAIYHFPSERPPPDSPLVAELASLNAMLVEAVGTVRDESRQKNYHLKAMAIVECEWAEVIYLDSDNIPAADPAVLFDAPGYKRLGVMFWPDYWKTSPVNPIWQILGVQCRDEWEQEAGQIVIDKRRHLDAMLLSLYMLIDWKFWYYFSDGDKDVFRFSFLALRKRWALPGRWVGGGALPQNSATGYCSHTMQQFDHTGEPMFVHYNLLKQIPSGVFRGFTWGRTKQVTAYPEAPHEVAPYSQALNSTRHQPLYIDPTIRGADDVEADMLANADDDGTAIQPATDEVRRRAALERGIRVFFHGGVWSALCIDFRWEDPNPHRDWTPDGTNTLGIDWNQDPLQVVHWSDDERLRSFEQDVYNEGFVPTGQGF